MGAQLVLFASRPGWSMHYRNGKFDTAMLDEVRNATQCVYFGVPIEKVCARFGAVCAAAPVLSA